MDGNIHAAAGGAAGLAVAYYTGADIPVAVTYVLLGGFSGLAPDLDVNGALAHKITLSKKWLHLLLGLGGVLLILYCLQAESGSSRWIGIGLGGALLLVPGIAIKQKTMLLFTGIAIVAAGIYMSEIWMVLLGVFIGASSFLPHRSLTHSLIGLGYYGLIGYYLQQSLQLPGVMHVCLYAYASHLILDMKWIPGNKRGVRLLQPFSRLEI